MKIGRFLLASFFAGESCGQGTDLAQLAASFSPEQLAALQSVLGANKVATPTGVDNPAPVNEPAAVSAQAVPSAAPALPTLNPTTRPTNATTLATEAPVAQSEARLEGASVDLEQQTGRIEDSPLDLIPEGPSENVNPAEDMPLSNFDPLAPISASNPAPQTPSVPADPVVTPAEPEPVPETQESSAPAPLTSGNSDILSLLQGKSPEQIAALLALAQGTSSTAPAEETPALETQPAALETPAAPEALETQPVAVETPAALEETPAVSVEAPTILEQPLEETPAPVEAAAAPQQVQSTGLGLQIAQQVETTAEEVPVAATDQETEEALPEVSTELFPEGEEEGEEVLNFEGDTPEENEEIGENPRIQVLEGDNEEEIPQISEPELEIPTETETNLESQEGILDNEYIEVEDADDYDDEDESYYDDESEYESEYDSEYDEHYEDESSNSLWGGFQNLWGDSEETTDNTENEKILQQEASNGDLFTEHDDEMAEDKAKYNFAFFMILFVFGTTGVYYIFTTVKSKFFPQSNDEQSYKLLPKNDADIKQSASSEDKEEWNNDDW